MGMFSSKAQMVESTAFDLLLKGLLAHSVEKVSVSQADSMKRTALFLDARAIEEYNVSHIPNAIHIGYDHQDLSPLKAVHKNRELVVYCSVGYRSEKMGKKIREMGFSKVYNLYGGIFEWKNQGKPTVNQKNQETDSVHIYNSVWGFWLEKGIKVQ